MNNIYNPANLILLQNTIKRLSTQINEIKKSTAEERKDKAKKWGKKFEDKRDWKEYDEKLVRRGELYLSLEFLENWDNELDIMNEGKKGAPFSYPEQFVLFMAFVYSIFNTPYRQLEGFLRKLSDLEPIRKVLGPIVTFYNRQYALSERMLEYYRSIVTFTHAIIDFSDRLLISRDIAADYTTLFKRIAKMNITLPETISENEKKEDIIIAVDSSGVKVKVTNRGEWMREKWRVHRGWIKAHIAVDIKTKETLAIEITDETVVDSDKFDNFINQTEQNIEGKKIKRTLGLMSRDLPQ